VFVHVEYASRARYGCFALQAKGTGKHYLGICVYVEYSLHAHYCCFVLKFEGVREHDLGVFMYVKYAPRARYGCVISRTKYFRGQLVAVVPQNKITGWLARLIIGMRDGLFL
jgi:hypothetical protein